MELGTKKKTYFGAPRSDSPLVLRVPVESKKSVQLRQDNSNREVKSAVVDQPLADRAEVQDFHPLECFTDETHSNADERVQFKNVERLQKLGYLEGNSKPERVSVNFSFHIYIL